MIDDVDLWYYLVLSTQESNFKKKMDACFCEYSMPVDIPIKIQAVGISQTDSILVIEDNNSIHKIGDNYLSSILKEMIGINTISSGWTYSERLNLKVTYNNIDYYIFPHQYKNFGSNNYSTAHLDYYQ